MGLNGHIEEQKGKGMKRIVAIIEKGKDGGYGIYAADGLPLFSNGLTEQEAKNDFHNVVVEQAEYMKERTGKYPDWFDENGIDIDYRYDMTAFFLAFPFINVSELAKVVGINPSLMRKYKSGIAKASPRQKDLIQQKFDDIVSRLRVVKF